MAALIVVLAVALAYVQVLGGPFLWDDRLLILGAPLVDRDASLGEYLRQPFWAGSNGPAVDSYYRPFVTLSFALDHWLHGSNAGGYHLTNLGLHVTCALLLFVLIRKSGVRPITASLVASGWALQPRLAEAAAWISGRTDLIASMFVLGSLLCWGRSSRRRVGAGVLIAAGLFAKESAVAAVPAVAVIEWMNQDHNVATRTKLVAVGRALLPVFAAVCAALAARFRVVGVHVEGEALGFGRRAVTVLDAVGTYVAMVLDPFRPRAVIGRPGAPTWWTVVLGGCVLVAIAALAVHQRRHRWRPSTAVGFTLAAAALLPVLQIVPIPSRTLTADRFLYLPTAGLVIALAPRLDRALALRRTAWLLASAALVSLGWSTARRAAVWSDEVAFWVQTYLETPSNNSAAATDLVGVLYRAGLYRDALALSERERWYDDPAKRQARFNSALCLDRLGRPEEALALLRATRAQHHRPDTEAEIAVLELKLGQWDSARSRLTALVNAGYEPARPLLQHLPDYERARAELARVPETAVAERAKLATFLGDETTAVAAWLRATSDPGTSDATLRDALRFLVQTGDPAAIATVARRYIARHAALPPDLGAMVSERLDEIDRATAVLPRLGLAADPARSQR